jgi:hypothetical protein
VAQAPDTPDGPRNPDLLAAVVLHTLVMAGSRGTTIARTIEACERDPGSQADREEIEAALRGLSADGLAYRRGAQVGATRAALRADALSF